MRCFVAGCAELEVGPAHGSRPWAEGHVRVRNLIAIGGGDPNCSTGLWRR